MKTLPIEFVNRNGLTLRGIATMPDGEGHFPTVINLHGFGGMKAGYKGLHITMARALAEEGIGCIRFDFSYNGESDGEFEDMTFTSLLNDTEDMWNWAKTQDFVDPEKMILSGHSMGGFVAATASMMNMQLFILIFGLIYLVEVVSVMIQVAYFKKTGGKRFFKMAPIHHHFELCGWPETKVVAVFSIVTAVLCLVGFLAL